eukprot:2062629-Pyramimonas_sp.AAC.1
MGVAFEGEIHDFPAGVAALYAEINRTLEGKGTLGCYDRVLRRWAGAYLVPVEAAICDVESKVSPRQTKAHRTISFIKGPSCHTSQGFRALGPL